MTAPVTVRVIPSQGPFCEDNFTISFFVPFAVQVGGRVCVVNKSWQLCMQQTCSSFGVHSASLCLQSAHAMPCHDNIQPFPGFCVLS
jgi:hypothetical protein